MILKLGSKGQEVKQLQARLGGIVADGVFGPATDTRVKSFQAANGLTVDGIAGWKTQVALGQPVLSGIDVSKYQGDIDWPALPRDEVQFAFVRATQGPGYVDPYFQQNRQGAWSAGIPCGFYHFADVTTSWRDNLDNFCRSVYALRDTDLPPVLDVEAESINASCTPVQTRDWLQAWLQGCQARLGARPLLYTGVAFLQAHANNGAGLSAYADLWASRWGSDEPPVQETQEWAKWAVWQYNNKGLFAAIPGNVVDLDYMSSTFRR